MLPFLHFFKITIVLRAALGYRKVCHFFALYDMKKIHYDPQKKK